jgi:hypothetical protein
MRVRSQQMLYAGIAILLLVLVPLYTGQFVRLRRLGSTQTQLVTQRGDGFAQCVADLELSMHQGKIVTRRIVEQTLGRPDKISDRVIERRYAYLGKRQPKDWIYMLAFDGSDHLYLVEYWPSDQHFPAGWVTPPSGLSATAP